MDGTNVPRPEEERMTEAEKNERIQTQLKVWCDVVWCDVVWCGMVWCGEVWCGAVLCDVV